MSEVDKNYKLEIFKMMVNKYLDESTSCTERSLDELEINRDQITWDLASKIYKQSGHNVEFSLVRDIVDSRIRSIKYQLAEEARHIAEQKAEEARRIAKQKAEETRRIADVLGKFGGDECKAKVFVRIRAVISKQLSVEESEVTLDSHLSNHLNADELDLVELVMALEEEFGIEIPDEISEEFLDIRYFYDRSSSWWGSSSSSPSSYSYKAGEKCIVRNFVDLISKKISD